ncbi:uncharacterized protein [Haliotis asinina]|uniref:uncharacterized protein n=1 Tax=Haliotis asinina TaxID=109174 RepID=UPI0035322360
MIVPWICVVVFMIPNTFTFNEISVNGNCSRTRPPEQFVVWGKPGLALDCTLLGTNRCTSSLPQHLQGDPADPPSSLSVSGMLIPDPNDNSSPQITIEWDWEDAGTGHLEGFLLHIHTHNLLINTLPTICRIFDLSGSAFNATGTKLTFQKKLIGISGGSHLLHQLGLSSLPRHSTDVRLTKFLTLQPFQNGTVIPARNWIPYISYDKVNFTAPATIEVRFSLAAPTYGFRQYRVMLVSNNDSLNAVETCIISTDSSYVCQGMEFGPISQNETTVLASFTDVAAGQYVIHIQPLDPYGQDDARCLCHSTAHNVKQCQPCLDTPSAVLTVVANTETNNTTTLPVAATTTKTGFTTDLTSTSTSTSTSTPSRSSLTTTQVSTTNGTTATTPSTLSTSTLQVLASSTEFPNTETLPVSSSQVPAITSSGDIAVRGNCSRDFPPEPLAVWGTPRSPLDCTMWNTARCNDSLPPHLEGNISATPPGSFSVKGVLIRDPKNNSCPQIIITWTTAKNDSRADKLKGFLLEIRKYDSVNNNSTFLCRILDFSSTSFTASDGEMKFQKKMVGFSGGSHLLYQLDFTSLPRHSPDVRLTKFFTLQPVQKGSTISASNWTPFISYDEVNFTAPATVEARFSIAPARYNFSQYTVMLVRSGDSLNAIASCRVSLTSDYMCQDRVLQPPSENSTTVLVSFMNISAGEYTVHIQPVDPYSMDDSRCLCYASVANGNRICQGCLDTVTTVFTVVQSAATTNSTIVPIVPVPAIGEDRVASIVGSVFGAVMGVIMVIIVAAFRINRYMKVRDGKRFLEQWQNPNNNQGKKVIILNTEDHHYHTKVVSEFALFLHNSCGCSVSYLPWEKGKLQDEDAAAWVLNRMDESDFIIVINSRIAFETYKARSRDTTEQSVFSTAMSHIHAQKSDDAYFQRFLFIHFSYTEEHFFIKDINPAVEYQMPEQLPRLLNHIHGMQGGEDENNVRASLENMFDKLQELITKSKKYEKTNPQWFASEQIQEAGSVELGDNICSVSQADGNAFINNDPRQTEPFRAVQHGQYRQSQRYLAPAPESESASDIDNEGQQADITPDSSALNEPGKTQDCRTLRTDLVRGILAPSDVTSDIATSEVEKRLADLNFASLGDVGPTEDSSASPGFGAKPTWKDGGSMLPPSDVTSDISTSLLEKRFAGITLGSLDQVEPPVDTSKPSQFGAYVSKDCGSSFVPPSDVASDTATSQVENGLAMHTLHSFENSAFDGNMSAQFGAIAPRDNDSSFVTPSDVASDTATSQVENGLAMHTLHSLGNPAFDGNMSAQFGAIAPRDDDSSILPPSDVASDTAMSKLEIRLADITMNSFASNLTASRDYSHVPRVSIESCSITLPPNSLTSNKSV